MATGPHSRAPMGLADIATAVSRGAITRIYLSLCCSRLGAAMVEHDPRARAFSFFSNDF